MGYHRGAACGNYILVDTKCGTGIEAIVNLHETDMVQFEKDPDIIAFTS